MSKKNSKPLCWVCGCVATRSNGFDEICDNLVCEQVTLEHMALEVAEAAVTQKEQEFKKGRAV